MTIRDFKFVISWVLERPTDVAIAMESIAIIEESAKKENNMPVQRFISELELSVQIRVPEDIAEMLAIRLGTYLGLNTQRYFCEDSQGKMQESSPLNWRAVMATSAEEAELIISLEK